MSMALIFIKERPGPARVSQILLCEMGTDTKKALDLRYVFVDPFCESNSSKRWTKKGVRKILQKIHVAMSFIGRSG